MRLVEQHCISKNDARYAVIDAASFASKNLYNADNYIIRQSFIHEGIYKDYGTVYHEVKHHDAYKALPAKVANDVLRLLGKNWKSFFKAIEAWKLDPTPFVGRPCLPKYKDKQKGRNVLIYDIQALSRTALRKGVIAPSMLDIEVQTRKTNIQQVRIVPHCGFYMIEVVYEQDPVQTSVNPSLIASVDIGVNNLVALTSNKHGFVPRLVNGRPMKSVNQFYNKRKADLQAKRGDLRFTSRMERITMKRTRRIIDLLVQEGIGTLIIGKISLWKQDLMMRKKDIQHFVQIPHARFVNMLCYKAQLVSIRVIIQEESYTSKASFLDDDPIPMYGKCEDKPIFLGRRVKRGLYQSRHGIRFNSDVNGSYNILRKASPDAFMQGSRGCAVHPIRLAV